MGQIIYADDWFIGFVCNCGKGIVFDCDKDGEKNIITCPECGIKWEAGFTVYVKEIKND